MNSIWGHDVTNPVMTTCSTARPQLARTQQLPQRRGRTRSSLLAFLAVALPLASDARPQRVVQVGPIRSGSTLVFRNAFRWAVII